MLIGIGQPKCRGDYQSPGGIGKIGRLIIAPTVSRIIKQLKSHITKQIGFPIWQPRFNDHIIRNEREYQEIWQYIEYNPLNWLDDDYYT